MAREVKYLLEVSSRPGASPTVFDLSVVQGIRLHVPPAKTITWTLGETPIREFSGIREQAITITGRSGVAHRLATTETGGKALLTGPEIMEAMTKLLVSYEDGQAANQQATPADGGPSVPDGRMILRAIWENWNYIVEPISLDLTRDIGSTRFSYAWTLSFRVLGVVEPEPLDIWGTIAQIGEAAADLIDSATAYIAVANEYMQRATTSVRTLLVAPVQAVNRLALAVSDFATNIRTARAIPTTVAKAVLSAIDAATQSIYDVLSSLSIISGNPYTRADVDAEAYDMLALMEEMRRQALESLGHQFQRDTGTGDVPLATDAPSFNGLTFIPYAIRPGDSLSSIALKLLDGDLDILLSVNGMTDPTVLPTGQPFGPGAVILVPSAVGLPGEFVAENQTSVYGTDFLLMDGDLVGVGSPPRDVALVSGPRLLKQDLENRLNTVIGENAAFPDDGLPPTAGEPKVSGSTGLVSARIVAIVESDPRIAKIQSMQVVDSGDTRRVSCTLIPKYGNAVTVNAAV